MLTAIRRNVTIARRAVGLSSRMGITPGPYRRSRPRSRGPADAAGPRLPDRPPLCAPAPPHGEAHHAAENPDDAAGLGLEASPGNRYAVHRAAAFAGSGDRRGSRVAGPPCPRADGF